MLCGRDYAQENSVLRNANKRQTAKSSEMIEEFVKQNLRSCGSSTITPPGLSGRSLPSFYH
jgi:hypothetical protein